MKRLAIILLILSFFVAIDTARAEVIAVFGNNNTDDFINTIPGFSAVLVSDAQLATPGFLSSFDAFYFTRDGSTFGNGLSAAAAANVAAYVGSTGDVVLFPFDAADGIGDATINQLTQNAVQFAAASGNGFIGEFNGAVSALTSNSNLFNPIGLIAGSAGPLGFGNGGSDGSLFLTLQGLGNPVVAGITFPFNPTNVEFGAAITGVDPSLVVATFGSGPNANPGIIVLQQSNQVIPEPTSLALFGVAVLGGGGYVIRRRRRRLAAA